MMNQPLDPILEEIHETRREIAKRFNYDIRKISEDARRRQELEGRPLWRPKAENEPRHTNGGGTIADNGKSSPSTG